MVDLIHDCSVAHRFGSGESERDSSMTLPLGFESPPASENSWRLGVTEAGIPIVCDVVGYLAIAKAPILAEPLTYLFAVADSSLAEESTTAVESVIAARCDLTVDSGEKGGLKMIDQGNKVFVWNRFSGTRLLPFRRTKLLHDGAASLLFLFTGHYRMRVESGDIEWEAPMARQMSSEQLPESVWGFGLDW